MITSVVNRKILIVEDDPLTANTFAEYFKSKGNQVYLAGTLAEAKAQLSDTTPDAVILDIILPDGEGLEFLRAYANLPPVIVMSSLNSESDMLESFSAGALDYVVKPASPRLVEARLSLRLLPAKQSVIHLNGLSLDTAQRTLHHQGNLISITGSEFNILWFLMRHPDTFFDANTLYESIWEMPSLKTTSIKYHISNLRRKLKTATQFDLIDTEFGKGYCFRSNK